MADCLFKLQAADSFKWELQHEQCLRSLLNFLATDAVVRPYSTNIQPTLITDASYLGLGAILEQEGRPVLCVSRPLTKAEQGYSQTLLEALAIHWATNRLRKYLHNVPFKIATDHKALDFI